MTLASPLRRHVLDALVVLLAVTAEIKVWIVPGSGPKAVFIVGSLLWTLPLLLRRRLPFAAPVLCFAVQAGSAFADPTFGAETTALAAFLLAFWVVGAYNDRDPGDRRHGDRLRLHGGPRPGRRTSGAIEAVSGILIGGTVSVRSPMRYSSERKHAAELEERAAGLERERERTERARGIAEERRRIARELHDVIAHSITLMTVQAGAARLLLDEDPKRARESVVSVEETGRHRARELRRLLGILRPDEGEASLVPQPGLARIDDLIALARRAGLPVELAVEGEQRVLPPGVDLTAYRIVQEALTNAHKHGGPARAHVLLQLRDGGGRARGDERRTDRAERRRRCGLGLVGMRERVALYDGTFEAGPRAGGGYAVRARLPVEVGEQ